ncbi:MAG: hypothetical protein ACERKD_09050 [Prolixibacteraceae bacterium]
MFKYCLIFFLGLSGFSLHVTAQQDSIGAIKKRFDQEYGLNVQLYNGHYYYSETNIVKGNPFWKNDSLLIGDLFIAGNEFKNQFLRYDLYRQNFLLIFTDQMGAQRIIVLDSEKIDSIKFGDNLFQPNHFSDINNQFIQLLHKGKFSCYLNWTVERNFNSTGDKLGYQYLKNNYEIFMDWNGELRKIKKRKQFIELFPLDVQNQILVYIKEHSIRWRRMNLNQLKTMLNACDKYLE